MNPFRNRIAFLVILLWLPLNGTAQQLNYSEIFGDDWKKALSFLDENDSWMKAALVRYNIPYDEIAAVIFPELVRYSAISDKMEITLLKALYRNIGKGYADFSVGRFQIKPSCAEKIRKAAFPVMGKNAADLFMKKSEFSNNYQFRAGIISDLVNPRAEFNYIIAFYIISAKRFETGQLDKRDRVRLLATAYNAGFWKKKNDLEILEDKKFFNTKLFKTENYSYADVALYWYDNHAGNPKQ